MKRIATIAVLGLAIAAPAAGGLGAASAASSSATAVKTEREVRIVGTITKLTARQLVVKRGATTRTFRIGAVNTAGFSVGDRVEAEGRVRAGKLVLSSLKHEDRAAAAAPSGGEPEPGDDRGGQGGDDGPAHS
jgi:hypothetical protein